MNEEILKLLHKGSPGASVWERVEGSPIVRKVMDDFRRSKVNVVWWTYDHGMKQCWPFGPGEKLKGMELVESCVNAIDYMRNWDVASRGKVVFVLHDWHNYVANNYHFVESQKTLIKKVSETEGMHIMMVGKFKEPLSQNYLSYLVEEMGLRHTTKISHYLFEAEQLKRVLDDLKVRY